MLYVKHHFNFQLSPNNRVSYIYKTDDRQRIREITCVSLEIKVNTKWVTILYYDDTHGKLHRHTAISLESSIDIVDYNDVTDVISKEKSLQWAIEDIKSNYLQYKETFVKDILGLVLGIDIDDY